MGRRIHLGAGVTQIKGGKIMKKWDKKIVTVKETYPQPCPCLASALCDAHAPDWGDMLCGRMLEMYVGFVAE